MTRDVVVWGNCQAAPLGDLLRAPLAAHGLRVVDVPAVYLVTAQQLRTVHDTVRGCAALIAQPVSDEYRHRGCGTEQLAALLPRDARLVRLPVVYDVGLFPFQVHGHDEAGGRVDAPLTDYHDLRVLDAACRGLTVADTVAGWDAARPDALRTIADASLRELRRRERGLDIVASDLVRGPDALWTMTHPSNRVLAELARRVLDMLGLAGQVTVPDREYLGQRRAPVEAAVAAALDVPVPPGRGEWLIDGRAVPLPEIVGAQLELYRRAPGVVAATLARHAERRRALR